MVMMAVIVVDDDVKKRDALDETQTAVSEVEQQALCSYQFASNFFALSFFSSMVSYHNRGFRKLTALVGDLNR